MTRTPTLDVTMPSEREVTVARVFDAPRDLVFQALTTPDLLRRWLLGPPGWSMVVCDLDLRVGGAYRFEWDSEDGRRLAVGGVYREVNAPEGYVATERFDDPWDAGESVVTTVLSEQGETTTLTLTIRYESREARDGVLAGGMTSGLGASYDRLDEILASATPRLRPEFGPPPAGE